MLNLDNQKDFNSAIHTALSFGMLHVSTGQARVSGTRLLTLLSSPLSCGPIRYRRFHLELLKRAYGLPFINQQKVNYANQIF